MKRAALGAYLPSFRRTNTFLVSAGVMRGALKGSAFWITHPIAADLRNNSLFFSLIWRLCIGWVERKNNVSKAQSVDD